MSNPLSVRALTRLPAPPKAGTNAEVQARKLADLYIKRHTNDAGVVTNPEVYQYAIDTYLSPFAGNVDTDRKIEEYMNTQKKITTKQRNQDETIAAFKRRELEAWFNDVDGDVGFRNPEVLALNTSQALDQVLLQVINAIEERDATDQPIDALLGYADTLANRSESMRDLSNRLYMGGFDTEALDGFGYYVDSNPLDGSVRGAALVPVGLAPEELTRGMRRVDTTAPLGNAKLPVYLPSTQDEMGDYVARLGDNTWSGGSQGALQGSRKNSMKNNFNIQDSTAFPRTQSGITPGNFGRIPMGARDESGKPVDSIVYKGMDNKMYTIDDPNVIHQMRQDPFMAKKLDGYVMRMSPTEAEDVRMNAMPFDGSMIRPETSQVKMNQFAQEQQVYDKQLADIEGSFSYKAAKAVDTAKEKVGGGLSKIASFFGRKNKQSTPSDPVASRGGQMSAPDVVSSGEQFFRQ